MRLPVQCELELYWPDDGQHQAAELDPAALEPDVALELPDDVEQALWRSFRAHADVLVTGGGL
jgi:hypothetical protein